MIENRYYLALPGPNESLEVKRLASKGFEVSVLRSRRLDGPGTHTYPVCMIH